MRPKPRRLRLNEINAGGAGTDAAVFVSKTPESDTNDTPDGSIKLSTPVLLKSMRPPGGFVPALNLTDRERAEPALIEVIVCVTDNKVGETKSLTKI